MRISGTALTTYDTPSSERYDGGLGENVMDLRCTGEATSSDIGCGELGVALRRRTQ